MDSCLGLPSRVYSQLVSLIEKAAGTGAGAASFAAAILASVGAAGLEHAARTAIEATRIILCIVFPLHLEERQVTGLWANRESGAWRLSQPAERSLCSPLPMQPLPGSSGT